MMWLRLVAGGRRTGDFPGEMAGKRVVGTLWDGKDHVAGALDSIEGFLLSL